MCTLIVLDRVVPGAPLVVASNRDEYLGRPSAPPALMPAGAGAPAFVAPQDLEAGGTWMGVNERGLFVGLTNRPPAAPVAQRSRGLLVRDALLRWSAAEAAARLRRHATDGYSPFHLFLGDGRDAFLCVRTVERAELSVLEPGRHVICNRDPGDPSSTKIARLRARVDAIPVTEGVERVLGALARLLRGHPEADQPLENPCVHTPGYGTRSSTLLAVGAGRWGLWHAEGPPCEAKYRNLSRLLDSLRPVPTA